MDEVLSDDKHPGTAELTTGTAELTTNIQTMTFMFTAKIAALEQQVLEQQEQITQLKQAAHARTQVIRIMRTTMCNLHREVYGYTRDFQGFENALP